MNYSCIIWDWNGTLADDAEASRRATNGMLIRRGMEPITMEQYYAYMDTPIRKFYEHLFDMNTISMETIGDEFYELYPKYFCALHRNVETLLKKIQEQGIPQIILTSGNREIIHNDTERFGIRHYFSQILGADDLMATGKVERAKQWIGEQQMDPDTMVMIGDTLHDFEAAQAMGTRCILFSGGHQARADLVTAGVPVVDSMEELDRILEKGLQKA